MQLVCPPYGHAKRRLGARRTWDVQATITARQGSLFAPATVWRCWLTVSTLALLALGSVQAQTSGAAPTDCRDLTPDSARLECYDRAAGRDAMLSVPSSPAAPLAASAPGAAADQPPKQQAAAPSAATPARSNSLLSRYWELSEEDKRGTFNYTGYRPNVLFPLRLMRPVNQHPVSPTRGVATDLPKQRNLEAEIQLSLRSKIAQGVLLPHADLWIAYTQQSKWQFWSRSESRPFRNTDYQPELIYVVPTPTALRRLPGGWSWRMSNLGLLHESNGQTGALSRSWNRLYLMAGFEQDDLIASLRLERRIEREDASEDDNPDIEHYMGRSELELLWTPGRSTATLNWRPSLSGRGALQLDWTYPVANGRPDGLRWFLRLYHGHGDTLLDYNFRQNSVSLGLTIFKF